ncbi:putative alpha-ribazole phosphatase [Streptomyces sp. Tu6071]|nr:putative alpha-ribazole phosphatase [Streptomyces sp. Tu6071]
MEEGGGEFPPVASFAYQAQQPVGSRAVAAVEIVVASEGVGENVLLDPSFGGQDRHDRTGHLCVVGPLPGTRRQLSGGQARAISGDEELRAECVADPEAAEAGAGAGETRGGGREVGGRGLFCGHGRITLSSDAPYAEGEETIPPHASDIPRESAGHTVRLRLAPFLEGTVEVIATVRAEFETAGLTVVRIGKRLEFGHRPVEPAHAEEPHGQPVRDEEDVRRVVRGFEAAEKALQEGAHAVVHVGAGFALREAVEEMPVGVAVRLLQAHVVAVLPVPPVLLPQPRLLADPDVFGVQVEEPQGLVGSAVRGDVDADAFVAEECPQPVPGGEGLGAPGGGQAQGVVGLALVHTVVSVAVGLTVPDQNDASWSCHALQPRTRSARTCGGAGSIRSSRRRAQPERGPGQTVQEGSSSTMAPSRPRRSSSASARVESRCRPSGRYLPRSAVDCHMDRTRNSLPGASAKKPRTIPGEPAMAGFQMRRWARVKCSTRSGRTRVCAIRTRSTSWKSGSKPVFTSKR